MTRKRSVVLSVLVLSAVAAFSGTLWGTRGTTLQGQLTPGASAVIDDALPNTDTKFTTVGGWQSFKHDLGYEGDLLSPASITDQNLSATWTFPGLAAGQYKVYVTYKAYSLLSNQVPYVIKDGTRLVGKVTVNQRVDPSGNLYDGKNWQLLGTVTITGNSLSVTLTRPQNLTVNGVIADAARIELVDSGQKTGLSAAPSAAKPAAQTAAAPTSAVQTSGAAPTPGGSSWSADGGIWSDDVPDRPDPNGPLKKEGERCYSGGACESGDCIGAWNTSNGFWAPGTCAANLPDWPYPFTPGSKKPGAMCLSNEVCSSGVCQGLTNSRASGRCTSPGGSTGSNSSNNGGGSLSSIASRGGTMSVTGGGGTSTPSGGVTSARSGTTGGVTSAGGTSNPTGASTLSCPPPCFIQNGLCVCSGDGGGVSTPSERTPSGGGGSSSRQCTTPRGNNVSHDCMAGGGIWDQQQRCCYCQIQGQRFDPRTNQCVCLDGNVTEDPTTHRQGCCPPGNGYFCESVAPDICGCRHLTCPTGYYLDSRTNVCLPFSVCGDGYLDLNFPLERCETNSANQGCPPERTCVGCQQCSLCGNSNLQGEEECEADYACGSGRACDACRCADSVTPLTANVTTIVDRGNRLVTTTPISTDRSRTTWNLPVGSGDQYDIAVLVDRVTNGASPCPVSFWKVYQVQSLLVPFGSYLCQTWPGGTKNSTWIRLARVTASTDTIRVVHEPSPQPIGSVDPALVFARPTSVKITKVVTGTEVPAPLGVTLIDDGDQGFSVSGTYETVSSPPTLPWSTSDQGQFVYGDDYVSPPFRPSWAFSVTPNTAYKLFVSYRTFTQTSGYDKTYSIVDGWNNALPPAPRGQELGHVTIDGSVPPNGPLFRGVQWEELGTFSVRTSRLTITGEAGFFGSDAVRIERSGSPSSSAQSSAHSSAASVPCAQEGEVISEANMRQCCAGLLARPNIAPHPVTGLCPTISLATVCARYPNGECGLGENYCNAPHDCPVPSSSASSAPSSAASSSRSAASSVASSAVSSAASSQASQCAWEGEIFSESNMRQCCEGLNPWYNLVPSSSGTCPDITLTRVCIRQCGDGECTLGENECNCEIDCPIQSSSASSAAPFCGNGIVEGTEVCDGSQGCSGDQFCHDCTECIDIPPTECGNGQIDSGEECDGSNVSCSGTNQICTDDCRCSEAPPSAIAWQTVGSSYYVGTVSDYALFTEGQYLYLVGGMGFWGPVADEARSQDGLQWQSAARLPQPLSNAAAFQSTTNDAFLLGGLRSSDSVVSWAFTTPNLTSSAFTSDPSLALPTPRYDAAAFSIGRNTYLLGGRIKASSFSSSLLGSLLASLLGEQTVPRISYDTFVHNGTSWQKLDPPLPIIVTGQNAFTIADQIYVFDQSSDDHRLYQSQDDNAWTQVGALPAVPAATRFLKPITHNGAVWLIGKNGDFAGSALVTTDGTNWQTVTGAFPSDLNGFEPDSAVSYKGEITLLGKLSDYYTTGQARGFVLTSGATGGPTCGNGGKEGTEQCDDGNRNTGDGCSYPACQIESGWVCESSPSVCARWQSCATGFECMAVPYFGNDNTWHCGFTGAIPPGCHRETNGTTCGDPSWCPNGTCGKIVCGSSSSALSSSASSAASPQGDILGYQCAQGTCQGCFVSMGGGCQEITLAQCQASCGGGSSASSASSVTCAQNGQKVYVSSQFGPTQCCSKNAGLKPNSTLAGDVCIATSDGSKGTCVNDWWRTCPDGTCGTGEDKCSCPRDCPPDTCGNSRIDPGEECDPTAETYAPQCRQDGQQARCLENCSCFRCPALSPPLCTNGIVIPQLAPDENGCRRPSICCAGAAAPQAQCSINLTCGNGACSIASCTCQ